MPAHGTSSTASKPDAPTIGTNTAGNAQCTVTFSPPAYNGGAPITSYTVTMSPGGATATGAGSPLTVTGLANATAYTATVVATNSAGNSVPSAASNSDTTNAGSTTPGAPTIGAVTRGNGQVTVAFTPPGSNGGATIDSYRVTSSPGGITKDGSGSPLVVTGLTNGTPYTFSVKAHNTNGFGSSSAASASVTPATTPGAPTIGTAAATGTTTANVPFTAPGSNGGSAITSYTATSTPGGITKTGASSPLAMTGLSPGTAYTFKVTATNALGTGSASAASNSITTNSVVTPATVTSPNINVDIVGPGSPGTTKAQGSSHATVSNGVGPFTYAWAFISGGTGITLTNANTSTVTAATTAFGYQNCSGVLRCTVTDQGNGNVTCTDDDNVSLVIEP